MRNLFLSLLICISFSVQGFSQDKANPFQDKAGPFGLHRGMTQDEIIALVGKDMVPFSKGDDLGLKSVPKPHPDFEGATLSISPENGLLRVMAMTKNCLGNDEVRDKFYEILDALEKTYGKAGVIDTYWPRGRERWLQATWKTPTSDLDTMYFNAVVDSRFGPPVVYRCVITCYFVGSHEYFEHRRAGDMTR